MLIQVRRLTIRLCGSIARVSLVRELGVASHRPPGGLGFLERRWRIPCCDGLGEC